MTGKLWKATLGVAVSGSLALSAGAVSAAVTPYAVDASTLQLWHLDGNGNNAVAAGVNLTARTAAVPVSLAGAAYNAAFGTSAGPFVNNQTGNTGSYLGVGEPANVGVGGSDNVNIALQDPTSRAFTFEAMVNLNQTSGTAGMELLSGEGEGATVTGDRAFQFRILPTGVSIGTSDNTKVRLEFNDLGTGGDVLVNLPDSITTNTWYHIALTYTGSAGTANNTAIYFTPVTDTTTTATLLANATLGSSLTLNNNGAANGLTNTDFALGNELRSTGNQNEAVLGQLDEVRISSVARTADQFIFGANPVDAPEPTTLAAVAGAGLVMLRRRRRRRA